MCHALTELFSSHRKGSRTGWWCMAGHFRIVFCNCKCYRATWLKKKFKHQRKVDSERVISVTPLQKSSLPAHEGNVPSLSSSARQAWISHASTSPVNIFSVSLFFPSYSYSLANLDSVLGYSEVSLFTTVCFRGFPPARQEAWCGAHWREAGRQEQLWRLLTSALAPS